MLPIYLLILPITAVASFSLMVTSFATPEWASNNATGFSTGLNTYCNWTECYAYGKDDKYGAFFATLFFIWVSIILLFGNVVFNTTMLYYTFKGDDSDIRPIPKFAAVAFGITGIPGLIAMVVFTATYPAPSFTYGYSFFLGWASCCLNYAVSFFALFCFTCCCPVAVDTFHSGDADNTDFYVRKHKEINDL